MRARQVIFGAVALILQLSSAHAACEGADLIAALPAPQQAQIAAAAATHAHAQGNLFRATRGTEVLHLVGTMHLPDPRHDRLMAMSSPLFEGAKTLLVEASPDHEARLKAEIVKRPEFISITKGPLLNELLPPEDWKILSERMQLIGVPPFVTAKFRPWYLSVMMGLPPCAAKALRDGGRGLDHMLMDEAETRELRLVALEPYDTLFGLFGDMSLEDEIEMIRASLLSAPDPTRAMVTTANAYFAGQSRLMWEYTLQQALETAGAAPEEVRAQFDMLEELLIAKRNEAWIPVIEEALTEGPAIAAFGALHLSGKDGVLALLEARGFSITRLDGSP